MPVTDEDEKRVAALILRDVVATIVIGQEKLVQSIASHHRQFGDDFARYVERVAEDVQPLRDRRPRTRCRFDHRPRLPPQNIGVLLVFSSWFEARLRYIHAATVMLLALASLPAATDALSAEQRADPLRPLTQCEFVDGLRVAAADRAPAEIRERKVATAAGARTVSLADGYRVLLAYPGSDYFANVKLELSQEARYAADKQAVVANMEYLANRTSQDARATVPLQHDTLRGFDMYGFDFPTIDFYVAGNPPTLGGGPVGTYVLLHDTQRLIVTVYLLNQRPERRRFKTIEEYRDLRDRFLDNYTTCLQK